VIEATEKEVAALQAFEDAYNRHWGWPAAPIDPNHPIQRATLVAIRAAKPHLLADAPKGA
jgi:hypothetical protein